MKISVINGPNINFLGIREPDIYGTLTYENLCNDIEKYAIKNNVDIEFFQSNGEKEIIDYIQSTYKFVDGYVINPAAYTHYSIAILDAIKSVPNPFVEVHISNIHSREDFRSKSVTSPACIGIISGFGEDSYKLGIQSIISHLNKLGGVHV